MRSSDLLKIDSEKKKGNKIFTSLGGCRVMTTYPGGNCGCCGI